MKIWRCPILPKRHESFVAIYEVVAKAGQETKRGAEPSSPMPKARRGLKRVQSDPNEAPLPESGIEDSSFRPSSEGKIHVLPSSLS